MPTLITLSLLLWAWQFLWDHIGLYVIWGMKWMWVQLMAQGRLPFRPLSYVNQQLDFDSFSTRLLGVGLSILIIYIVGVFVGNLLGRTAWRLVEHAVMKIPLVRAIYPAVKQVTDFLLSERTNQFEGSKVVAVEPHEKGIWSIGLVTGTGLVPLSEATQQQMVTVFVPSSPTAFSGYVLMVPRNSVVELPIKVEEAMRLLVSGGVITPTVARPPAEILVSSPIATTER
jgi:uncharacterized membrane protein